MLHSWSGRSGLVSITLSCVIAGVLSGCGGSSGGGNNAGSSSVSSVNSSLVSSSSVSSSSVSVSSVSLSSESSSSSSESSAELSSSSVAEVSSESSSSESSSSLSSSSAAPVEPVVLKIEENSPGMIAFFPTTAYTGTNGGLTVLQGLSNNKTTTPITSAFVNYSVNVAQSGDYQLRVHYAFGGTETNIRDTWVYVNGAKVQTDDDQIIEFAYTGATDGKWNTYAYTDYIDIPLIEGDNDIRLVAVNTADYTRTITFTRNGSGGTQGTTGTGIVSGLPNLEHLEISGPGPITPGTGSTVLYSLSVGVDAGSGSVSLSPEQDFYLPGSEVTLIATPGLDERFDSWTGDKPSVDSNYSLVINGNLNLKARFIPAAAIQPETLVGYGAIQSDDAVPYTLTGGAGAPVTTVTTLAELKAALASGSPLVIKVSGLIDNSGSPSESLTVPSNTTIFGDPDNQGHLKNIELKLSGKNYILHNLKLSEVVSVAIKDSNGTTLVAEGPGNDVISINGGRHVWIDHCELYSSLTPAAVYDLSGPNETPDGVVDDYDAKDFYDGLIDIKNSASFITLSNNYIHNHWKGILIGSGDNAENGDAQTRITLHNNHFKDIISRIPLLRYGKGHFFNNYVQGTLPTVYGKQVRVDSIFNMRQGAHGLIEGNYVEGAKNTFGYFYTSSTTTTGFWNLADNTYVDVTNAAPSSTSTYTVPYEYTLESSASISTSVPTRVGVGILTSEQLP